MDDGLELRSSGRPRAGRRFQPIEERELSEAMVSAARSLPQARRGLLLVNELAGPIGIPDLVAVIGPPEPLSKRLEATIPPMLNALDTSIIAQLYPAKPSSLAQIAKRLSWSESVINRRLPTLAKNGAIERVKQDRFVRSKVIVPVGRIYAIEAKIRDWRRALRQGRLYSTWADNYVLVMSNLSDAAVAALTREVEADGGGAAIWDSWIVKPRVRPLTLAQRLQASEHVVAAFYDHPSSRP